MVKKWKGHIMLCPHLQKVRVEACPLSPRKLQRCVHAWCSHDKHRTHVTSVVFVDVHMAWCVTA